MKSNSVTIAILVCFTMTGFAMAQDWGINWQFDKLEGQRNDGFQVTGLSDDDLRAINGIGIESGEGQKLIQVFVARRKTPMLGRVALDDRRLVFEPRFPLDNRLGYELVFHGEKLNDRLAVPLRMELKKATEGEAAAPRLGAVYPGQDQLPQNLLKMYIQFDQPMVRGKAYEHIRFLDSSDQPVETPYLEIPEELWSADRTRLTLLFDPGRIKRGLQRHEQMGPPFEIGKSYTMVVSTGWLAESGGALDEEFRHTFSVVEPDRIQPAVSRWKVTPPNPDSLDPLHIRFGESLDFGMLQHSLAVIPVERDIQVAGEITVDESGRDWRFHPEKPWKAGDYIVAANPRLEDRAGNSLAQPFERSLTSTKETREPETSLRFHVRDVSRKRPNIVFILADDLGWRDLSCEGSTFYESPNIDRICNEGIRFSQGYAACQVCSPSRAAIMTGKSPARLKITDYIGAPSGKAWKRNTKLLPAFYRRHLPHEDISIAEAFREAGYRTFFAGKWHLGDTGSFPEDHGFDVNIGGHRVGTPPGGFFVPYKNPRMTDGPRGECLPVRLGQETADFIEENKDEPFFAFLSFYSVHAPIQSTEALWNKYRQKAGSHPDIESRFVIDRTLPVRQVQDHPLYAGMVESMDDGVGKVLDALDRLGLAEDTIVVFTSDNGGVSSGDGFATSNLPLRGGKGRQWEAGIREPFYIRWKETIAAGSRNDTPVIGTDFYPTLLDLCDLPARPDQHLDGVSLKPILDGGVIADRNLIWHYPHYGNQGGEPSSIIRDGDWKMIRYFEDGRTELYHVRNDIGEQNDVSDQYPDRIQEMTARMDAWLVSVDAEGPETNPGFDAEKYDEWKTNMRDKRLPNMERNHARFLDPEFRPRNGWWEQ